jgi:hypothetical protein
VKTTERDLEQRARRLEGETLVTVRYQRAGKTTEAEHAVEHLVFLDFASGGRVAVGTDDALGMHHGFGISLEDKRVIDPAFGDVVDVSDAVAWRARIGSTITSARILWGSVYDDLRTSLSIGVAIHADYLRRADYPSALRIELGGSRPVTFLAARRAVDGTLVPFVNALLVSFTAGTPGE